MEEYIGVFSLLLQNSWDQYKANFKTALVFALLLVFVPVFALFPNIYLTSGSIFIDYNVSLSNIGSLLAAAGLIALFLLFYSFFLSIIILSVRKNLSKLKLQVYLHEMIQKFTLRIFAFYVLFCLLLFLASVALISAGVHVLVSSLLLFMVSFLLMFVPQAVVVDEEGLRHALLTNFEFLASHPKSFVTATVIGAVLVALLQLFEFGLAHLTLFAPYVSMLVGLVFILPFVEILKTYQYMMRFELIKEHEAAKRKKPLSFGPEPESLAEAKKRGN